jgi:hypothetical protein
MDEPVAEVVPNTQPQNLPFLFNTFQRRVTSERWYPGRVAVRSDGPRGWAGLVIIPLGSLLGSVVPLAHTRGAGLVGGRIANCGGRFVWVWTLLVLGATATFPLGARTVEPARSPCAHCVTRLQVS